MLLYGNLLSLAGCVLMVAIGLIKKKNHILMAQCVQFAFMGAGQWVLGATAGVVANGISIIRNLLFARVAPNWVLKLVFILAQVAFTAYLGFASAFELLPIVATVIFTLSLSLRSDVQFKLAIIAAQLLWLVYDFSHSNYVNVTADVLTVVTTAVGIFMLQKKNQKPAEIPAGSQTVDKPCAGKFLPGQSPLLGERVSAKLTGVG